MTICESFPMGTHWLWHIFNSAGGFTAMLAIITLQTQGAAKRPAQPDRRSRGIISVGISASASAHSSLGQRRVLTGTEPV